MKKYGTLRQRQQLALNIEAAISGTGKSFHQISQETGIGAITLYNWAHGYSEPGVIGLKQFAGVMGIDIEQLTKGV